MKYEAIHQALRANGFTWAMAGEAIGCSGHHVMGVASRRHTSRRAAVAFSALIDKDVSEVFPDVPQYHRDPKAERHARIQEAKAKLESAGLRMVG